MRGEAEIVEQHRSGDDEQSPYARRLHRGDRAFGGGAEDRCGSHSCWTQGRYHGVVTRKDVPQIGDAAWVTLTDHHALTQCAEFLRRPYERDHAVPAFDGLPRHLEPGAAGRADDQKAHDELRRSRSIDRLDAMFHLSTLLSEVKTGDVESL